MTTTILALIKPPRDYQKKYTTYIKRKLDAYSKKLQVTPKGYKIKQLQSKWGSATDSGRLLPQLDSGHSDPIVLNGGIPDETVFPVDYLADIFTKIIKNNPSDSLMYGGWFGYEGCREEIATRQNKLEHISSLKPENIIMHNGSSGCMENICKTFINVGDIVLVESPSFSGTVRTLQGYGAEIIPVPMTSDGADVDFIKNTVSSLSTMASSVFCTSSPYSLSHF